jgi:glutathione S-transferase
VISPSPACFFLLFFVMASASSLLRRGETVQTNMKVRTSMMILHSAPPSPFGRKVLIALSLLGFDDVKIEATDTMDASSPLRQQNPLGKIPVLLAEDDTPYFDSRVILEYLDERAGGGKIVPSAPAQRLAALRLQALCDGAIDASILEVYEGRWRSADKHEPKWLEHQAGKVARALAFLEAAPPPVASPGELPHVGQIALACALGYRDLRFAGTWRKGHPRLVGWLEEFAARVPAFAATAVKI